MEQLFEKYGISPTLSNDQKLAALEKEKLKVLRKLNHVFGNPEKEAVLNGELEALERAMAGLAAVDFKGAFDLEVKPGGMPAPTRMAYGRLAVETAEYLLTLMK